jgi:excisionase family DNA binding protein
MSGSPPLPADVEQLLKPDAIARWLGCSRAVVYSEAKAGRLPCVIVAGKLVRFERRGVEEYIASRRKAG